MKYTKVSIPSCGFGHSAYAGHLSLKGNPSAPLVLFFGGSISSKVYHDREESKPENLINYFKDACGTKDANILIIPCPYGDVDDDDHPVDLMRDMLEDFLSQIGATFDDVKSVIGNSMGCYWALGLLNDFPNLDTLVTIAGAAMNSAISEYPPERYPANIHCYSNEQDYLHFVTLDFVKELDQANAPYKLTIRDGEHSFSHYEKNGSVKEAFEQAVKLL